MLYPQMNKYRQYFDLSGFWDFKFDPTDKGLKDNWDVGFERNIRLIAVPASWNDQFADNRDFLGPAWYQTRFSVPWGWDKHRVILRFSSVNYLTDVWLNGKKLGQHEGGHLPFEFDITLKVKSEDNLLVVRVDGNLARDRVPPGYDEAINNFPATRFDFFPFCGIHRPVLLYTIPNEGIKDITINTTIEEKLGKVDVKLDMSSGKTAVAHFNLNGHGIHKSIAIPISSETIETTLEVPDAVFWAPGTPNLYDLTVELSDNGTKYDSYTLSVGIRTISIKGKQLLLNGKPIFLTGFGRHEDFPVTGKGYLPAVIIKDYSLMRWIGANSFRTSHYPYSEQMMDLADRLGFLVIDETPAVGLFFKEDVIDRHLELCTQYVEELISRDKNHPSVIMWSLANEPFESTNSKSFFRQLFNKAKELDPRRPVTLVNRGGVENESFEFLDIVCLNRYYGWYTYSGQIDEGVKYLSDELDRVYEKYRKPVILSEFGADTIPGWHSQPPEMFSEEYQVEFLKKYINLAKSKDYIVGVHVWNMTDFKTGQSVRRVGAMNYKGVFTRDRRPKMAAHFLRKLWKGEEENL